MKYANNKRQLCISKDRLYFRYILVRFHYKAENEKQYLTDI